MEKLCTICDTTYSIDNFRLIKGKYRAAYCKRCTNKRRSEKRKLDGTDRDRRLRRTYGISEKIYKEMYDFQQGKCLICENYYDQLVIDHSHTSGNNRGLLCKTCNIGLGMFKDNPYLLEMAKNYLLKFK